MVDIYVVTINGEPYEVTPLLRYRFVSKTEKYLQQGFYKFDSERYSKGIREKRELSWFDIGTIIEYGDNNDNLNL